MEKNNQNTFRQNVYESLRSGYAKTARMVSTEASFQEANDLSCYRDFQIIEIPEIMEKKMQSAVGAQLMRRWFRSPKFVLPESWRKGNHNALSIPTQNIDTSIVKMSWVRQFSRAISAIQTLEANRITTPLAAKELRRVLQRQLFLTDRPERVGITSDAIVLHETTHINSLAVPYGGGVDPLDCALAAFTMHVAVGGIVEPFNNGSNSSQKTHKIHINKLHFYIRDSYDFSTEDEPLGYWGRDGASTSMLSSETYFVENRHFTKWREKHGKGGDFIVFSDVYTKEISKITIDI